MKAVMVRETNMVGATNSLHKMRRSNLERERSLELERYPSRGSPAVFHALKRRFGY
jgi:hypothetical protein